MKEKLARFTNFANSLYPHETDYLLSEHQFIDEDNIRILNLINYNCKNQFNTIAYDKTIDKRKYSNLKSWIQNKLKSVDIDDFFEWLSDLDKKINIDFVLPAEENQLLKRLKLIGYTHYYFIRFYELVIHYRDYLLIRVRIAYYEPVQKYLEENKEHYFKAVEINNKINSAAVDIIRQHTTSRVESKQWTDFLHAVFYNENLDGYTRYKAVVRLTYIYYNYRDFDKLKVIYTKLDQILKTDIFYSKRILANYYANRAMMHSKFNELNQSAKYGYLSIRKKNSDYLFYLINLCGVLLRQKKNTEALTIMSGAIPELKNTSSFYNKIGFVSFYVRTLNNNRLYENSESYAETFFEAYKKEVFKHRWHIFFCAYFQSLLKQEKYSKLLHIEKRYNLVNKEKQFISKARYLPTIFWYRSLAEYEEGFLGEKDLKDIFIKSGQMLLDNQYKKIRIKELIVELYMYVPEILRFVEKKLKLSGFVTK